MARSIEFRPATSDRLGRRDFPRDRRWNDDRFDLVKEHLNYTTGQLGNIRDGTQSHRELMRRTPAKLKDLLNDQVDALNFFVREGVFNKDKEVIFEEE